MFSSSSVISAAELCTVPTGYLFILYPGHLFPEAASVCGLAWVSFEEVKELDGYTRGYPRQLLDTCIIQAMIFLCRSGQLPVG